MTHTHTAHPHGNTSPSLARQQGHTLTRHILHTSNTYTTITYNYAAGAHGSILALIMALAAHNNESHSTSQPNNKAINDPCQTNTTNNEPTTDGDSYHGGGSRDNDSDDSDKARTNQ